MKEVTKPLKTTPAREKALRRLSAIFSGIKPEERKRMVRDARRMHHEEILRKDS